MNKMRFRRKFVALIAVLISTNAHGAFDSLCFFGTNGPVGPTMIHIFDWNIIDAAAWYQASSNTSIPLFPPSVPSIANNPRLDVYILINEGLEYSAFIGPWPLPTGVWRIDGSSTPFIWRMFPPFLATHPDAPFECSSTDAVM
jgi:hypothetical protein